MTVKITECPRDAMQGIDKFIPTETKIEYLNLLLKVGFDRLDFGSFVSPKAIPQLKDTVEVLEGLDLEAAGGKTDLLAIVANLRGAEDASKQPSIDFVGYPFSISETFQKRNTNSTIVQALDVVKKIRDVSMKAEQNLLIYISMGFGNPYGDPWNSQVVVDYMGTLHDEGIAHFALADTLGNSHPAQITELYTYVRSTFPTVELGLHLHSTPEAVQAKIEAALAAGCRRFDTALRGYGGCPMAADTLTGNLPTEQLIAALQKEDQTLDLNLQAWSEAMAFSHRVFQP